MPSSTAVSWNSTGIGDANVSDQFPAGLRVLVVDDDPTCLMILEKMLRNCKYEVTKCNRAEVALSLLRENKNGYDVVISDVHMPDMDGFKLLVLIGLEMDLPVIMMSADDNKSVVMKGVTHGACDYLIKPVRIEALRNIWQHVVRKRKHEWKDFEPSTSLDEGDQQQKQPEDPDYLSSANEGQTWKNSKRMKDEEDESEERDDYSSTKRPRVVWSVGLHQQFVAAVSQLGFDKAVPKKILDLMNVPGLTRENVASHLQKYRLCLRRLSRTQQSSGMNTSFMGNPDASYGPITSLSELDLHALAASGQLPAQSFATLQAAGNSKSPVSMPVVDQTNIFSFENPMRCSQIQNQNGHNSNISKQMNLLHGIPITMEPKQHSFAGISGQNLVQMPSQSQAQNLISRQPILNNPVASLSHQTSLVDFPENSRTELTGNTFPIRVSLGVPSIMSTSTFRQEGNIETNISREGFVPSYGLSNNLNQNKPHDWGLQGIDMTFNASLNTNNMQGGLNVLQDNYSSGPKIVGSSSHLPFLADEYSQDDLLAAILTQQLQQEGIGQAENEFSFDWHSLDNLPA